ncbi:hypothetical protein [Telluribacter sp.]|jgi:hypothetical protein|uniref:hypothetical protein n=1 Tax=Telluribacter sp. TaxID=1978767 RepID=UPI002E0EE571|nr:hypothetical protein [Telluribacter sp.]
MKTIHFSLDIKSFFVGAFTLGGILLLANFTPAGKGQSASDIIDTRRFQVVAGDRETVILDTQTGRFIVSPGYIGQPRWVNGDFEELLKRERK